MPKYISDPKAEVIGQNLLAFVQNTNSDEILPYLKEHGMDNIDPNQWYPLNDWLDVLSDMSEEMGASSNFVSIGMSVSRTAVLPPDVETLAFDQFLESFPEIYQMQHRNGDVGNVYVEIVGHNHAVVTFKNPYPMDLDYGALYGFARRFLPSGVDFTLEYQEGAELTHEHGVIDISWD